MNKEKFKKQLEMSGINGRFTASVEVLFNYRTQTKEVHNPSTHDEEKRTFSYHIVYGYIGGDKIESPEFQNEALVWQYIDEVEKKVSDQLFRLANIPKTQTLTEQLCGHGFTKL